MLKKIKYNTFQFFKVLAALLTAFTGCAMAAVLYAGLPLGMLALGVWVIVTVLKATGVLH